MTHSLDIVDVQSHPDSRNMPIHQVGIKSLLHPITFVDQTKQVQHTVASLDMTVALPSDLKGTHMSRFLEVLQQQSKPLSVANIPDLLERMVQRLEADQGRIQIQFPFFLEKAAPISQAKSLLDYQVILCGNHTHAGCQRELKVVVPVTSLCPCSKAISDFGAHNQRSHVSVTALLNETVMVTELITLVEEQASCQLYGLLKRADEKYVTEQAYQNPKFVEDMVRDVAAQLRQDPRLRYFKVESENFESIHNHSAYAMIEHHCS